MSEAELYERYLEERQWNYMSWEEYKEVWERRIATPGCGLVRNDKGGRILTSPAAPQNDGAED